MHHFLSGTEPLLWFGHPVTECSWNTKVIWCEHGCSDDRALGTRTVLWLGHGCSGDRMLLEP